MKILTGIVATLLLAGVAWLAFGRTADTPTAGGDRTPAPTATATATATATPDPTPEPLQPAPDYEPPAIEPYANAKRLAARVAQSILTFTPGTSAATLAARVPTDGGNAPDPQVLEPVLRERRSVGDVVYVQVSGVTDSSFGAMVVTRQRLQDDEGRVETVTRTLDIRLQRSGGPWSLASVGGVGGTPVGRPSNLSAAAKAVVDDPRIRLPDSARWDIYRGAIDEGLLRALSAAARREPLSVAVFRSGHPANVWATSKVSAHTRGFAVDIYGVGGKLVVAQRAVGSRAYDLANAMLAGGAQQVGSPWVLGPGGPRSFTDAVHQDHLHLQQSPVGTS